ncbi:hypothetical protein LXL04_010363 [Taraxacum kok-saghyz]
MPKDSNMEWVKNNDFSIESYYIKTTFVHLLQEPVYNKYQHLQENVHDDYRLVTTSCNRTTYITGMKYKGEAGGDLIIKQQSKMYQMDFMNVCI